MTPEEFADFLVDEVRRHVASAVDEARTQLHAEFAEQLKALPAPEPGPPGKDWDPEKVRTLIAGAVADAMAAFPVPKDGKDADPEAIKAIVAEAVAAIPAPKDGKDADPEAVRALIAAAVAELPVPKDGKDADPEMVRQMVTDLFHTMPRPKDGKDGVATVEEIRGLIDLAVQSTTAGIEERLEATLDARADAAVAKLPTIKYRRTWKEGETYQPGDVVTWGGDAYHCNKTTMEKPDSHFDSGVDGSWTLMVKKGRNGRDREKG